MKKIEQSHKVRCNIPCEKYNRTTDALLLVYKDGSVEVKCEFYTTSRFCEGLYNPIYGLHPTNKCIYNK